MSSCNGAPFIAEQIESILDQVGVDVHLYVRDDGSSDATPSILEAYADHDKVDVVHGAHLGIGNSFMQLLWSLPDTYDYYAFSDQDDIWMQDKLAAAVDMLEATSATLYASNLVCMDEEGNPQGTRFKSWEFRSDALFFVTKSFFYGCTQVFDRSLFLTMSRRRPSEESLNKFLHDTWVAVSASIVGTPVFDPTPHIGYRRHKNNHTAFDKGLVFIWKLRLRKLLNPDLRGTRSALAQELLACYGDCLDPREKDMLGTLAGARKPANRLALAMNRTAYKAQWESDAWFVAKTLAGFL